MKYRNQNKKRRLSRQQTATITTILSLGILLLALYEFRVFDPPDNDDFSLIGKGKPVLVQTHDPSCPSCRELKRVVDSLKPEFADQIEFLVADLSTQKGEWFAQYQGVSRPTLLFFQPDGTRVSILEGVQEKEFLRKALKQFLETVEES